MLKTIEGIYREGRVELTESPEGMEAEVPVLVTFLSSSHRVDLRKQGIDERHAAELRARLATFAPDWDSAEMDAYDDYDTARAKLRAR